MKPTRRMLVAVGLTAMTPLAILAACGSSNFSGDVADGAVVTGGGDGSTGDALAPQGDAGDAEAGPTWCQVNAPKAYFCADFDEGNDSKAYYKGVLEIAFSTLTIVDAGAPGAQISEDTSGSSPPGSLRASSPQKDASLDEERATASTPNVNAVGATGFQLDFDVRNDDDDISSNVSGGLARVDLVDSTVDGGSTAFTAFEFGGGTTQFVNGGFFTQLGPYPAPGVWTHFSMVVVLGGDTTVQLFDGGNMDVGESFTTNKMSAAKITLGNDCVPVGPPPYCGRNLSFDNVVIHAYGTGAAADFQLQRFMM